MMFSNVVLLFLGVFLLQSHLKPLLLQDGEHAHAEYVVGTIASCLLCISACFREWLYRRLNHHQSLSIHHHRKSKECLLKDADIHIGLAGGTPPEETQVENLEQLKDALAAHIAPQNEHTEAHVLAAHRYTRAIVLNNICMLCTIIAPVLTKWLV